MHRSERIADTLREEIAQIVGYELEDPRLTMVTVLTFASRKTFVTPAFTSQSTAMSTSTRRP